MIEADYLRYLTYQGARERYKVDLEFAGGLPVFGKNSPDETLRTRIEHELTTIEKAGFPSYFLIVADILRFCREKGIPTGPGRGSICGSAVAYATYITDVEPLQFGIPFERFLHLERIAQPDIDLDICQVRRQEVIQYLRDTYGSDSVAQIITFTPLNAKGVVRDVCRVLHVDDVLRGVKSNETGDKLAKMIPEGSGADQVKLQEYMDSDGGDEFKRQIESLHVPYNGDKISVLATCLTLEGLRRHGGVHAAGVVIADRPLIELAPLYRKNQEAEVQIQYDMRDAETAGLLKMDVLGLRTVSVLGEAESLVRRKYPDFNIKNVPLDDKKTFDLLSSGDTGAVFQLEGDGITAATVGMRPDRFDDIIALIALYRPGPMEQLGDYFRRKHGEDSIPHQHPLLKPILERTYGLMVYQEQVMGIVRALGGYTAGEADQFRKAIGKKLVPLIREKIDEFIERAVGRGHDREFVTGLGDQIFFFGRYGFNLGHATGYGFITYWTAYLKTNFPAEFFTANLNSQLGTLDKISILLRDAERHGIAVLPPDINESGEGFTLVSAGPDRPTIRFGIGAVKGLGDNLVRDILEERDSTEKNGYSNARIDKVKPDGTPYKANSKVTTRVGNVPRKFDGPVDFCSRLAYIAIDKKMALVNAGAFGGDLDSRIALASCMERLNTAAKSKRPFVVALDPANAPSELDALRAEREVLGFYLTSHPLAFYKSDIERYGATIDGDLEALDGSPTVAGLVLEIRTHPSKNGEMAWVRLESGIRDLPEITVFNSVWSSLRGKIAKDSVVVVRGKKRHDVRFGWGIIADDIRIIDKARPTAETIGVSIPNADLTDLLTFKSFCGEQGVNVFAAVQEESSGRIALIATNLLFDLTGHSLTQLESQGFFINMDPDTQNMSWNANESIVTQPSMFAGSGANRAPIWELPIVKRALSIFGGRVLAEMTRLHR